MLQSRLFLFTFLLIQLQPQFTKVLAQLEDTTVLPDCNWQADTCNYPFDGECDSGLSQCANGDCFDCDRCVELSLNCGECVAAGCVWCPYDGTCMSGALGSDFWQRYPDTDPGCKQLDDWQSTCAAASPDNVFTDPLYDTMTWVYRLINLEEVWRQGYTGEGIHVRVNDDGVDASHPEFANNFDVDNSCESYLPDDFTEENNHGTACASLIGGNADNGVCAVGVAPDVTLSACNGPKTLSGATPIFKTKLEVVDVISNSWGPLPCQDISLRQFTGAACPFTSDHPDNPCTEGCSTEFFDPTDADCEEAIIKYCKRYFERDVVACGEYLDLYVSCEFHSLGEVNEVGWAEVIAEGRNGKGPIITFAGGNDFKLGVDANSDGMVNSRYTIAVGAVGKDGKHASYSTTGAAIFLSAPGGDKESLANNIVANPGGGCHDITVGTSFATPILSGVSALVLQANPELGWRDVQGIYAATSQKVDLQTDDSWVVNGGGFSHSYKYGFGLVDALAAVEAAKTWQNFGPEQQIMIESGAIDIPIPDYDPAAGPTFELAVLTVTEDDVASVVGDDNASRFVIESAVVYLDVVHGSRGDLQIVLTSPQDTPSILAPSKRPENTILVGNERWKLMTLRNWGESPIGTWTLEIADEKVGNIEACADDDWSYEAENTVISCNDFASVTDCNDESQVAPILLTLKDGGKTILEACCSCGGGVDASTIPSQLRSWRLVVYGRVDDADAQVDQAPDSLTGKPTVSTLESSTVAPVQSITTVAPTQSGTDSPGQATPLPTTAVPAGFSTRDPVQSTTTPTTAVPAGFSTRDPVQSTSTPSTAVPAGFSTRDPVQSTTAPTTAVPAGFSTRDPDSATTSEPTLGIPIESTNSTNTSTVDSMNPVAEVPTIAPSSQAVQLQTTVPGQTLMPTAASIPGQLPPVESASCDYRGESCPFEYLFDLSCNNAVNECSTGDCFDCDPGQVFSHTSCSTCVENGFVWCPGDGVCLSVALDEEYWAPYIFQGKISSCMESSAWTNACEASASNFFGDPLFDSMRWMYRMISVEAVWKEGITGAGVHVRVNYNGVDGNHAELLSNFDATNSCQDYLPSDIATDFHGTAVASIIGGANNNDCAVGIAPNATISACKANMNIDDEALAQIFQTSMAVVDISSNSFGPNTCRYTHGIQEDSQRFLQGQCPFSQETSNSPCDICEAFFDDVPAEECITAVANYCRIYYELDQAACLEYMDYFVSCEYHVLPLVLEQAWLQTITEGRDGKGVVYVVSAGDLYSNLEDTNSNGMLNSRFTIAVGALGKDGLHASYSSVGSSVFISAPGGDRDTVSNNIVAKPGGGCHDVSYGTAFAAPVVSGVVALMLEANPQLTWRDVQGVLASTATPVDELDNSWTTNAAGMQHSSKYGFGIVNAAAAVTASRDWQLWGPEVPIPGESGRVDTAIPDAGLGALESKMSIQDVRNLTVESVVVYVDATHQSLGDLQVSLKTARGTDLVLVPGKRPFNQQLPETVRWKFLAYGAWGESPTGEWTLKIEDLRPGRLSDCEDLAWEIVKDDGSGYNCGSFVGGTDCTTVQDQTLITDTFEGRTSLEACCTCGGGTVPVTVSNTFRSWNMIVYTHDEAQSSAPSSPASASINGTDDNIPVATPLPGNNNSGLVIPGPSAPRPAPGLLTEAIPVTIPPNITNVPFRGMDSEAVSWTRNNVLISLSGMLLGGWFALP